MCLSKDEVAKRFGSWFANFSKLLCCLAFWVERGCDVLLCVWVERGCGLGFGVLGLGLRGLGLGIGLGV